MSQKELALIGRKKERVLMELENILQALKDEKESQVQALSN